MSNHCEDESITFSKLLLVEGKDEINLFTALLGDLGLTGTITIFETKGISKLRTKLAGIKVTSGYKLVQSIGIIRDADSDSNAAFQSVQGALQSNDLPTPAEQMVFQFSNRTK